MNRQLGDRRKGVAATAAAVLLTGLAGLAGLSGPAAAQAAAPAAGHPVTSAALPAGVPRYYVAQGLHGGRFPVVTRVRSTATGAVTAVVRSPWRKASIADGEIAAAGRHTFFVVCQRTVQRGKNRVVVTGSRIYRFRVTEAGEVTGYSLVPGGVLNGLAVGQIGAAISGSEIAVAVTPGTAQEKPANVMVINTRTGAHALWRNATGHAPGTVTYFVGDLSLTADGRELVFYAQSSCVPGGAQPCPARRPQVARALRPAARGGLLRHSRLVMRQSQLTGLSRGFVNDAVITPDGSRVTVFSAHSGPRSNVTSVLQVSATTGRQVRLLFRADTGNGFSYRFFNVDPTGRHVIMDTGTARTSVNGWVDHGRLVRLKPAGNNVAFEAW